MPVNVIPFSKTISIPIGGLEMERAQCPQISSKDVDEFKNHCAREGVFYHISSRKPQDLKPIQANLNKEKMLKMMKDNERVDKPVIISQDNFLLDGHHRVYAAASKVPYQTIPVCVFHCDINMLLGLTRSFPKTFYKDNE